jgi:ribokinase
LAAREGPVVLVVGSLQQDIVVHVPVLPLAGQHLVGGPWQPQFGGQGGLQAMAAARAGQARLLAAVGADSFGSFLRDGLRLAGVDDSFLQTREMTGSGLRLTIAARDGGFAGVSVAGANQTLDAEALEQADLWRWVGLLLLQDELPPPVNLSAAQTARSRNLPVLLHLSRGDGAHTELMLHVTHLVLDESAVDFAIPDIETAARLVESLYPDLAGLVLLAGAKGLAARDRGRIFTLPAPRHKLQANARDDFSGTLAAALARGLPLEPACLLARKAMG